MQKGYHVSAVIAYGTCLSLSDWLHLVWSSTLLKWRHSIFTAVQYSIVCVSVYAPHLFMLVSADGHLGCLQVLAIVNSVAINRQVCVYLFTL